MDFAVWPAFDRSWDETLALARFAEGHGYRSFWYADHMMADRADGAPDASDAYDCWTILAAIGAAVPRVRLVSMVSPLTIHHPVVLAKRATTVDHISGGRAVLGIGAGWQVNEHACYGFELFEPKARVARFAEGFEIIHRLLRDDSVSFAGESFTVTEGPFAPKPVQSPLPILVGGKGARMMRLTARYAQEWNTWGNPTQARERLALLHRGCEAEGRDPATLGKSVQAMLFLLNTQEEVDALGEFGQGPNVMAGSAAFLQEQIGQYIELGFDEFAVPDFTLGDTPSARAEMMAKVHEEVVKPLM